MGVAGAWLVDGVPEAPEVTGSWHPVISLAEATSVAIANPIRRCCRLPVLASSSPPVPCGVDPGSSQIPPITPVGAARRRHSDEPCTWWDSCRTNQVGSPDL